jgi:phosphoenolpyruvate carboxykinase (GTP)
LRRDPMAMLPFCGYNMGDYFRHWLSVGKKLKRPPNIFFVYWFRTDEQGKFMWPGFGDNIRVLEWITGRAAGTIPARETAIGSVPRVQDFNLAGLDISHDRLEKLFAVNPADWKTELEDTRTFYEQFGDRLPPELWKEFEELATRVS